MIAAWTFLPGSRLVDLERPAAQLDTVKRSKRRFSSFLGGHFDEGEPPRLPGHPVDDYVYGRHVAVRSERFA
jgi:hypothetical protein